MTAGSNGHPGLKLPFNSELDADAYRGLLDGDLQPLARQLRAGLPLSAATAELLADMIEDKGADWKILKPRGQTNNQQTWSKAVEEENQLFEIGLFVERELRADTRRGARKAIVYKAQLRFGVGSTKVNDAHRFIRQRLDEGMIQLALVSCPEI